jgi:Flp pilus assembly protein TadD
VSNMRLSLRAWLGILGFQVLFGASVFVVTRYFYYQDPAGTGQVARVSRDMPRNAPHTIPGRIVGRDSVPLAGSERITVASAQRLTKAAMRQTAATPGAVRFDDPESLARSADRHFQEGLFQEAASEYRRVLAQAPRNVDIYNNLGLTLHYIGRSLESVGILEQGTAVDANNPRIWLTLGFVQLNRGDTSAARRALATAAELDPGSQVGREAMRLLDEIPQ